MAGKPRRKRWLTAAVVLAVVVGVIAAMYVVDKNAAGNRVLVTISKETTYITGPLRPDGYPDYVAALNQRFSEGVTPENNSAVLFLKAVGPKMIGNEFREKYFRMLDIPPLPEKGDYFVTSDEHDDAWSARLLAQGQLAGSPSEQELQIQLQEQLELVRKRPWSKEEFPVWAEWIALNEKPLALLVEATKRPRRYDPLICEEDSLAFGILLPACQQNREVARALSARAMMRIHEGKTEEAWKDLLACHRLARLTGQGLFLVEVMDGMTIDYMTYAGDHALLEHGKLSAVQIAKMRADLDALTAMPSEADKIDNERLGSLDAMTACAQGRADIRETLVSLGSYGRRQPELNLAVDYIPRHIVAWNYGLRLVNSFFDQLAEAYRQPTRKARQAACDEIKRKIYQLAEESRSTSKLLQSPRRAAAQRFVAIILSPTCWVDSNAEDLVAMRFELTKLAFALAAYRAENGAYPEKLDELRPKYVKAVPKDVFNDDANLHYERQGDGYLLYSIGENAIGDGGKGHEDCKASEGWDDLGVRIPAEQ